MKIAIIGTGNVGQALGSSWAQQGHDILFGSRDPQSEKVQALLAEVGETAVAAPIPAAVAAAEVVVLAIPWSAVQSTAESIADWGGKILIDATNPIAPGFTLAYGKDISGAEMVARWANGARVVKAFNSTGAENMANPLYGDQASTMFIAGDDTAAKQTVTQLAEALGFDVADVGALQTARYLEPLAMVWIHLAMVQGNGRHIALKLLRRK